MRLTPLLLYGLVLVLALGCASAPRPIPVKDRLVAVFSPRAKGFYGRSGDLGDLHRLALRLVKQSRHYDVVPLAKLRGRLAKQRKRRDRSCLTLRCQRRLGPRLFGASHGLALSLRRVGRRCRTTATLYDFRKPRRVKIAAKHMVRGTCNDGAMAGAVANTVCHVSATVAGTPDPDCAVEGELFWLERMANAIFGGKLALQRSKLAERIVALKGAYLAVAQRSRPKLAVAAHCGAARLYDMLAQHLAAAGNADAPAFARQASLLYRACIARAEKHSVTSRDVTEARQRVAASAKP